MQIVFDAIDPAAQATFWSAALGYEVQPPPDGFDSWPAYLRSQGVSEESWNMAAAALDPTGIGPRLLFQRVPEAKSDKNRVHLDLLSGGGSTVAVDDQRRRVAVAVERLAALGATYVLTTEEFGVVWAVMLDPEGNEFCA